MAVLLGRSVVLAAGAVVVGARLRHDQGLFPGAQTATPEAVAGYVPNPGMGFQGFDENSTPNDMRVLYRRGADVGYTWAAMNPADGAYDWSTIDADLEMVEQRGWQLAFRVYTMRGEQYGGHYVPAWAVAAGAIILDGIEPDYRSRVYQQQWARFVDALRARYDGNPLVAFIDIAGYGEFNQWFSAGAAPYYSHQVDDPTGLESPSIPDGHARRHLIHMFTGGSGTCLALEADGITQTSYAYSHVGFQTTQLLMPYNGLFQSTQFVLDHFPEVGLRNDFLGIQQLSSFVSMGHGATTLSRRAPVVFETANVAHDYVKINEVIDGMGAAYIHDRNSFHADPEFPAVLARVGYRYVCDQAQFPAAVPAGARLQVVSTWRNTGRSKAYPRTGQTLRLQWALASTDGTVHRTFDTGEDASSWLPAVQQRCYSLLDTAGLVPGSYTVLAGVVNTATGSLIDLACGTPRTDRRVPVGSLSIT